MWIQNDRRFGIIKPFDRLDLQPLSLIIGLNGAGKSQLLRGISNGAIRSTFLPLGSHNPGDASPYISLLTNTDDDPIGLVSQRNTDLNKILSIPLRAEEASKIISFIMDQQQTAQGSINDYVKGHTGKVLSEHGVPWHNLQRIFTAGYPHLSPNFVPNFAPFLSDIEAGMNKSLQAFAGEEIYLKLNLQMRQYFLLYASQEELANILEWPEYNLFQPDMISTFLLYRDRRWRNAVQRQTDIDEGTDLALDKEEFVTKYGQPPWEIVSDLFASYNFPYSVAVIPSDPLKPVMFGLIRSGETEVLSFSNLSSGERVLVRMMLSSFQAASERINVRMPKLMLLDELDASLHPQNVDRWLTTIKNEYVDTLDIKCVLSTHSPTTVALAPEDSIYEISEEFTYPRPISKQQAIDKLTIGLPMLAINYSARRQVFTESTIDVDHYSMIHDIMRPKLEMDRTLSFVGTSTKGSCAFVYDMVKHMEANGNRSVFGIVDWDKSNTSTGRVKVLASGTHYAKDNVLLDPLLVGALLLKGDDLILEPRISFLELSEMNIGTLQRLSDAVADRIAHPRTDDGTRSFNHYWSGVSLSVRQSYQLRQGHELERALKTAFPMLEGRYRAEGQLVSEVIRRVLSELPSLCPKPVSDLLLSLANDDP